MTEVVPASAAAIAAAGAKPTDLDAGQTVAGAPVAPAAPASTPPVKTAEQIADEKAKIAEAEAAALNEGPGADAAKIAADKKVADDLAAAEAAKNDTSWQDNYIEFEDPSANAVVAILKDKGVSVTDANAIFAEAIKTGDVNKVDWATLEKKLGPAATQLARNGIEAYANGALKENNAIVNDTYEQLGGEANWVALRTWVQAQEKADPTGAFTKKIDSYRAMVNLGGESRQIAVEKMKALYDADPKTTGFGTNKLESGSTTPSGVGDPLSRADYLAALHKAHNEKAPAHVIKALDARRQAGKAARI